jgi:hypothetical protein
LIEVGNSVPVHEQSSISPSREPDVVLNIDPAWSLLVDARRNLGAMMGRIDTTPQAAEAINNWIGGGLAVLATFTDESAESLRDRLAAEVPIEPASADFYRVKRERPKPPPGAPKDLDIFSLTDEEREELGIILPQTQESSSN